MRRALVVHAQHTTAEDVPEIIMAVELAFTLLCPTGPWTIRRTAQRHRFITALSALTHSRNGLARTWTPKHRPACQNAASVELLRQVTTAAPSGHSSLQRRQADDGAEHLESFAVLRCAVFMSYCQMSG